MVGLPTDTVYGIGADPLSEEAVSRLFELKGRPEPQADRSARRVVEAGELIGEIEGVAAELAAEHWPGALTLVVAPKVILADWVGDSQRLTVGLRVPDHEIALELLEAVGPTGGDLGQSLRWQRVDERSGCEVCFRDLVSVYVRAMPRAVKPPPWWM